MCIVCDLNAAMRRHAQEHAEATQPLRERLEEFARDMQPASEELRRYADKMACHHCYERQAA